MKIRLSGLQGEVAMAVTDLREVFAVSSVSRRYPNRGGGVRVYVDAELIERPLYVADDVEGDR